MNPHQLIADSLELAIDLQKHELNNEPEAEARAQAAEVFLGLSLAVKVLVEKSVLYIDDDGTLKGAEA